MQFVMYSMRTFSFSEKGRRYSTSSITFNRVDMWERNVFVSMSTCEFTLSTGENSISTSYVNIDAF